MIKKPAVRNAWSAFFVISSGVEMTGEGLSNAYCLRQAPRSNFSAGARPQSKVLIKKSGNIWKVFVFSLSLCHGKARISS